MPAFSPPLMDHEIAAAFPRLQVHGLPRTGAQGSVFRVDDPERGALALKIYRLANAITRAERVEREIAALKRLDTPAIVRLVDAGEKPIRGQECIWTLTEFVHGENVEEVLDREPMAPTQVRALIQCVGEAIDAMWALHIVHRDIKPSNIMVRAGAGFVVIDLGIAKHLEETPVTEYGRTLGTLGYMSPEQMTGRKALTLKSDLFSLGIVSYLAATGEHPFAGDQRLVLTLEPRAPSEVAEVPADLSDAIMALLAKSPMARPVSGRAAEAVLR